MGELILVALEEVDGVVIGAAAQEHRAFTAPVRGTEAEDLRVEVDVCPHIRDEIRHMAELERADAVLAGRRRDEIEAGEQLDLGALGIAESEDALDAGGLAVAQLRGDAHRLERGLRLREVGFR